MWEQMTRSFQESLQRISGAIAGALPGAVAFLVIMLLFLVLALVIRMVMRRLLTKVGFDRQVQRWGFFATTRWSPTKSPAFAVARVTFWLVIFAGFLLGITVFDATRASSISLRILAYLPQVVAAAAIFAVGFLAARFLERSVLISAVNMQIHSARLLSLGVKWLITVLAAAMALEHLGIGGSLVTISFSILFGGIVLTLALAVGLGSRHIVSKTLEKQILGDKEQVEEEDDLRHL
jgi:hypothetical protein